MKIIITFFTLFVLSSCVFSDAENIAGDSQIPNSGNKVILALGDSITAGYGVKAEENYPSKLGNILEENGYKYTVVNAWVSGDTSLDLRIKADKYLSENPEIVLIVIGGNDGLRQLSPQDMEANISEIIEMYQSIGSKIILGGIDISLIHGLGYRKDFLNVYKNLAEKYPDIYFLKSFLKDVAGVGYLNQLDKIHPTAEGYDIIVTNLYEFLEKEKLLEE